MSIEETFEAVALIAFFGSFVTTGFFFASRYLLSSLRSSLSASFEPAFSRFLMKAWKCDEQGGGARCKECVRSRGSS